MRQSLFLFLIITNLNRKLMAVEKSQIKIIKVFRLNFPSLILLVKNVASNEFKSP